jgi:ribosomal protein L21E
MKFDVLFNKALVMEAADYGPTPPKAKYQEGDIVVIRDNGSFANYHNKKIQAHAEHVGIVVGYRKGSQIVRYAVQFDDGSVHLIHSHFLIGPFKSKQIAETYVNNKKELATEDLDMRGKVVHDTDQRNEKIEAKLCEILENAPFNVEWVERKIDGETTHLGSNPDNGVKVVRVNDKQTRKLKRYVVTTPRLSEYTDDTQPVELTHKQFFDDLDSYKKTIELMDGIKAGTITPADVVCILYRCSVDGQGNKIAAPRSGWHAVSNSSNLFANHRDIFKDWNIHGNFTMQTDKSDLSDAPKSVTGSFGVYDDSPNLKSLHGMPLDSRYYYVIGFTDKQIQDYIDKQKYTQAVRSHDTTSGDTDIDKMFDDILDDI